MNVQKRLLMQGDAGQGGQGRQGERGGGQGGALHLSFVRFVEAFVREPLRSRWLNIGQAKKPRWQALDPHDLLKTGAVMPDTLFRLRCRQVGEFFAEYGMEQDRRTPIVVASLGHGGAGLYQAEFECALSGRDAPLEGLLLYRPERFVLVCSHDGEIWVLSAQLC